MRNHRLHELGLDLLSLLGLVVIGFVVDRQTEVVSAVNEATGQDIPAVLLAGVFAAALNARRELRDWRERRKYRSGGDE